jgi:hypothetical protein
MRQHYLPQVSPFGHPRINACKRLPGAYRSLLRPSSPASAKASTVCPFALDHKLPANVLFSYSVVKELALRQSSPQLGAAKVQLSYRISGGEYRIRTGDLRLARAALSQLS